VAMWTGTNSLVKQSPANGFTYTGNASYGLGSALPAASWFVVYAGPGTSVTVSNLLPGNTYNVAVFSYVNSGSATTYGRNPAHGSVTIPPNQVWAHADIETGDVFVSFSANLFNDAAVAIPSPIAGPIPSETVSTALKHGWAWKIPLTSRFGNGYVYSTQFCSPDAAEAELRQRLGLLESDVPARHLKMKIGRVTHHWNRNCLAVGLSQGFIEPLEATALLFIQQTAATFVEFLERGDLGDAAHELFNRQVNDHFEGTRDYIVTHYKTNSRQDTEYWRANAANLNLSDNLKKLYSTWMAGKSIASGVREQVIGKGYPVFSWYSIMAGMGIFPDPQQLRPPTPQEARYSMAEIDNLLDRSSDNYPDHRDALARIAPHRTDPALQIYFW